ncbi:Protein argonaute 4A [Ananas comosus]|uniref:Protein argonaute 4A n=1 Tax=Ananas comosus TaxID=4615 RepID=A0A199VT29_ANACO|nr:Protein argonaute 4A [Ananas comosus]
MFHVVGNDIAVVILEMEPHNGVDGEDLPPPPPIPPNVVPTKADSDRSSPPKKAAKPKRVQAQRPGVARRGQQIPLYANHFKVSVRSTDDYFYHYSVSLKYEDDRPVDGKGVGRRVIDKLRQTYDSELGNKDFAYDGEKSLFTLGSLPHVNNEFTVVLEDISSGRTAGNGSPGGNDSPGESDRKRVRRPYQTKAFKVELSFAAKIPMQSLAQALKGYDSENSQEALRVLDIILRQHSAKQGCLLVRQSFFHNNPSNFVDLGGGVMGCRGFHSSFRTTQSGLSLNIDVSTTMIVKPGPVIDFLLQNQNVNTPYQIDWAKDLTWFYLVVVQAKRMLKNLRIKTSPQNTEYKIVGLSELPCNEQTFVLKQRNGRDGNGEDFHTSEITVYEYFVKHRNIELRYSADLPCINVGKPKRPTYIPMELCNLVSLQRYTKALSNLQRASLVEKSRQKPQERMRVLNDALKHSNYDSEPMLRACGISIATSFTQVEGRVLPAPKLKVGNGEDFLPRNGRWNFNNKKLVQPSNVDRWAVVNFSARCDIRSLVRDLIKCGDMKGISIEQPFDVFEESPQLRRAPPTARVEDMFQQIKTKLPGAPRFLLCLLPERKNCDVYGPWKRKCLAEFGIVTQCIAPTRVNDQYLTNVLLKINAKLGGINSLLHVEHTPAIPLVSKMPTIILGMDVSHGQPGQSDVPSIAAVVSSRQWPLISKYRASVRTQSPKVEMIDSLFRPTENDDQGIMRELLVDFYTSSGKRKPDQIIIFSRGNIFGLAMTLLRVQPVESKDGVSESQFNQVLNIELDQIIEGTTRPTHYHVLLDEIGFSPDDLQELVHSLSYVYQRSTTAISVVAPICYAHLAATQVGQFMKFDDSSETSSSHGGHTSAGSIPVPELPRLHEKVSNSMFFC